MEFYEEQSTEEQKKKEDIRRVRKNDDALWVLSTAKGRRLLTDILEECGVWRASFIPKDSMQTAFNEGKRDIGLYLIKRINETNPTAVVQMHTEWLGEQLKNRKKGEQNA